MKLSRTASNCVVLGGLALIGLFLFLGVAVGGFGLSAEMNELVAQTWLVYQPWEILLWAALTSLGSWYVLLGIVMIWSYIYLVSRRKFQAGMLMGGFVFAEFVTLVFKNVFNVARPEAMLLQEAGGSFPSGHTVATVVVYGLLALYAGHTAMAKGEKRWMVLYALLLMVTVGVSRVAIGAHYPNDVLGGWLLGGAIFFFLYFIFSLRYAEHHSAGKPSSELALKGLLSTLLIVMIGVAMHLVQLAI